MSRPAPPGADDEDWAEDDELDDADVDVDDVDLDDLEEEALADAGASTSGAGPQPTVPVSEHHDAVAVEPQRAPAVSSNEIEPAPDTEKKRDAPSAPQQPTNAWSWAATWSTLSSAIKEDVQDLTQTFQRAIDNVKEEIRTPLEEEAAEAEQPAASSHARVDQERHDTETDKDLQIGLQAIDDQVDKLTSTAVKALGSLWTGLGGAINSGLATANTVATRVEHAALQAASTVIERVEQPRGNSPSSRQADSGGAWNLLRRARQMFEGQDVGFGFADASGLSEDDWDLIHHLDAPENAASVSFDQLFRVYRGHRFADELEEAGSRAAKECNRARATLSATLQAELDRMIATLATVVDMSAHLPPSSAAGGAPALELSIGVAPSCAPGRADDVPPAYAALAGLCAAAVQRAQTMRDRAAAALQETLRLDATAPDVGEDADAIDDAWADVQDRLFLIRAEGLKLVAEFTSLALQHLISMAATLHPASGSGEAQHPAMEWPAEDEAKGVLVKSTIEQLLADLNAICVAFCQALDRVGSSNPPRADSPGTEQQLPASHAAPGEAAPTASGAQWLAQLASVSESLVTGLREDGNLAGERLVGASKHLVYPVCLACARRLLRTLPAGGDGDAAAAAPSAVALAASDAPPAAEKAENGAPLEVSGGTSVPESGGDVSAQADAAVDAAAEEPVVEESAAEEPVAEVPAPDVQAPQVGEPPEQEAVAQT